MGNLKKFFLDLLFPIQCLGCGLAGEWLCNDCLEQINIKAFSQPYCFSQSPSFLAGVWIATDYSQPLLQTVLHNYKYNFVSELGRKLADLLIKFLKDGIRKKKNLHFDLVIPIPLAKKRIIWRGFNQAEILAQRISQEFSWLVRPDLIKRVCYTHPQVGLSAQDRISNVKGIFKVTDCQFIKNKKILLIDDVITTGATLSECAKVLKQAGAKEVWGLVLAKG